MSKYRTRIEYTTFSVIHPFSEDDCEHPFPQRGSQKHLTQHAVLVKSVLSNEIRERVLDFLSGYFEYETSHSLFSMRVLNFIRQSGREGTRSLWDSRGKCCFAASRTDHYHKWLRHRPPPQKAPPRAQKRKISKNEAQKAGTPRRIESSTSPGPRGIRVRSNQRHRLDSFFVAVNCERPHAEGQQSEQRLGDLGRFCNVVCDVVCRIHRY